jgi:hypothetical protein
MTNIKAQMPNEEEAVLSFGFRHLGFFRARLVFAQEVKIDSASAVRQRNVRFPELA